MPAQLLDGKAIADIILKEMKETIIRENLTPGLAVILVGNDPASALYVGLKEKAAQEIGITVFKYTFPETASEAEVIHQIKKYNADLKVHGILVQLPLPGELNANSIIAEMDPNKDVDGFHPHNKTGVLPPVVAGTIILLNKTGNIAGKHAVVVANNPVFSQTFCDALRDREVRAEPTFVGNTALMREADILVTALGKPGSITKDMIKPGATVIDVGISKVGEQTVGDVAPEVADVAAYMTPVPGGVGPMTVAMLLRNVVELCRLNGLTEPEGNDVRNSESN
jgi:methylenetetrahydrofolate dehydrogenase (NADP+)/methenyltetrahydrofolate cyclohydrolase